MPFDVGEIAEEWGSPTFFWPVPQERFTQFSGLVPEFLLETWREFGYSGFRDGLWWLCDPIEWQPAVDVWTADLELPMGPDTWIAVTRTAFGKMELWGRRTGMSLTIVPYDGSISPTDNSARMADARRRDAQVYATLLSADADSMDVEGFDDEPLFGRVLAALGPVARDTVYGFVPIPALGGPMLPDHVQILDAEVHLQILSDFTPRQLMLDNPFTR